jgi:hypothetical protein
MASKVTMGASSEVFPDLHHKMSKKIAQLTKVIYHLNTRNEVLLSFILSLSLSFTIYYLLQLGSSI